LGGWLVGDSEASANFTSAGETLAIQAEITNTDNAAIVIGIDQQLEFVVVLNDGTMLLGFSEASEDKLESTLVGIDLKLYEPATLAILCLFLNSV